jgi:hypothetical protein
MCYAAIRCADTLTPDPTKVGGPLRADLWHRRVAMLLDSVSVMINPQSSRYGAAIHR